MKKEAEKQLRNKNTSKVKMQNQYGAWNEHTRCGKFKSKNAENTRKKRTEKNAKSRLTTSGYEHQHAGTSCSEIRARYHPNPTPDRWPLESLPLGSETGIQVSAIVGIGDHLGRQLPVSLLVPVSVASVDTTDVIRVHVTHNFYASVMIYHESLA